MLKSSGRLRLRALLNDGVPAGGLFQSIAAPEIIDIAAASGFDFVLIDLEHTLIDGQKLEHLIAVADRAGLSVLVRVPDSRSEKILQVLDAGAAGIVIPRCSGSRDAMDAVSRARYAPLGSRGLNAGRLGQFGDCDLVKLIDQLNRETLLVVMIEDREGLSSVGEISRVDGVDGLLLGAADFSQAIGQPWKTSSPAVFEAEERLAEAALSAGKYFFAIPRCGEDVKRQLALGAQGIISANDRGLLRHALSKKNEAWRTEMLVSGHDCRG